MRNQATPYIHQSNQQANDQQSSRGMNHQQLCKIGDIIFDSIHDFLLLNFYHRTNSVANRKRRTRILADSKINYISSSQPANTSQRSEEHTSELQSLMRISYAVFCLKKKKNNQHLTRKETNIKYKICK